MRRSHGSVTQNQDAWKVLEYRLLNLRLVWVKVTTNRLKAILVLLNETFHNQFSGGAKLYKATERDGEWWNKTKLMNAVC